MVNAIRGVNEVLWSLVKKEECGFYPWEQCKLLWGSAEFQPCKNQLRYFLCGAKIQVPILCQGPGYPGPAPAGVFVLAKMFLSARYHILFLPPPQSMFQSKWPFPPVRLSWLLLLRCSGAPLMWARLWAHRHPLPVLPPPFQGVFVMLLLVFAPAPAAVKVLLYFLSLCGLYLLALFPSISCSAALGWIAWRGFRWSQVFFCGLNSV